MEKLLVLCSEEAKSANTEFGRTGVTVAKGGNGIRPMALEHCDDCGVAPNG